MDNLTSQLSGVVESLRSPGIDPGTAVRHVVFFLPLIKNPLNLGVLVAEVAASPILFSSVESVSYLVDGIAAAAERKRKMSDPTIPYQEWSAVLVEAASRQPALPAIAVVSGLLMAHPGPDLAEKIIVHDFKYLSPQQYDLAVACLARAQWHMSEDAITKLPVEEILATAVRLIYSPQSLFSDLQGPIFAELGAYSRLISSCLRWAHPNQLLKFLDTVDPFVRLAVAQYAPTSSLNPYKVLFFGVTLQLEGLGFQVLHNQMLPGPLLAEKTIVLLQPLNFIVEETGSSFEAYRFLSNLCLDVLFENSGGHPGPSGRSHAIVAIEEMGHNWRSKNMDLATERAEVLYFLETSEKLLPLLPRHIIEQQVLPAADHFLIPERYSELIRPLFEAAHSLMLAYLELVAGRLSSRSDPEGAEHALVNYFVRVMDLFPLILTYGQFRIALDGVFRAASHPTLPDSRAAPGILDSLFCRAKTTMPGLPIPGELRSGEPPTLRSAYISELIRGAPLLCDPVSFRSWLLRIGSMVRAPYSEATAEELKYVKKALADTISGLDLTLADVGIQYWFAKGANL